jgi:CheY-like chemotaxis protein
MTSADAQISKRDMILLVEDHPSNVLIVSAFLDLMGYACETAENGYAALKKFADGRYALIIMDVQMPGIDGLETARRIRKLESDGNRARTPILAMTSGATVDDKLFCLRAGMDDYLSKPFRGEELSEKLQSLLPPDAAKISTACS